jgi:hypothetical protein
VCYQRWRLEYAGPRADHDCAGQSISISIGMLDILIRTTLGLKRGPPQKQGLRQSPHLPPSNAVCVCYYKLGFISVPIYDKQLEQSMFVNIYHILNNNKSVTEVHGLLKYQATYKTSQVCESTVKIIYIRTQNYSQVFLLFKHLYCTVLTCSGQDGTHTIRCMPRISQLGK